MATGARRGDHRRALEQIRHANVWVVDDRAGRVIADRPTLLVRLRGGCRRRSLARRHDRDKASVACRGGRCVRRGRPQHGLQSQQKDFRQHCRAPASGLCDFVAGWPPAVQFSRSRCAVADRSQGLVLMFCRHPHRPRPCSFDACAAQSADGVTAGNLAHPIGARPDRPRGRVGCRSARARCPRAPRRPAPADRRGRTCRGRRRRSARP
jgi:hypothetical protein